MAAEYDFYTDATLPVTDFVERLGQILDAQVVPGDTVATDGMSAIVRKASEVDIEDVRSAFGFDPSLTVIFRFDNLADETSTARALVEMVTTVTDFLERTSDHGVLLFEDERVILQKLTGSVEFDDGWDFLKRADGLASVVSRHGSKRLPQPLL